VLDLDGTLAETNVDLIGTLNVILAREGADPIALEQAKDVVGAGARAMLTKALALRGRPVSTARLDELYADFLTHYADNLAVHSRLFDGVEQALHRFSSEGWLLAVCTNKIEAHSLTLLRALGVAERFGAICGRDTFPFCKPDPRHLLETIKRAGGDANHAVMVGDSRTDIDTAKAARIPAVAVTFGYTDVPVHTLGPDAVIDHFDELWDSVAAIARRIRTDPISAR
jgi:phosphoglycolate phosphatase